MKRIYVLFGVMFAIILFSYTINNSNSYTFTEFLGVGNFTDENELIAPITVKANADASIRLHDLVGNDTTAEADIEFYNKNDLMGEIGFSDTNDKNLHISNNQDNGWLEFQTMGLTKNMIDPNGWMHVAEGIRFGSSAEIRFENGNFSLGDDLTLINNANIILSPVGFFDTIVSPYISTSSSNSTGIYFRSGANLEDHLAIKDLPKYDDFNNLFSIRNMLFINPVNDVVGYIETEDFTDYIIEQKIANAASYDSISSALNDSTLPTNSLFKVEAVDSNNVPLGYSALYIKE